MLDAEASLDNVAWSNFDRNGGADDVEPERFVTHFQVVDLESRRVCSEPVAHRLKHIRTAQGMQVRAPQVDEDAVPVKDTTIGVGQLAAISARSVKVIVENVAPQLWA